MKLTGKNNGRTVEIHMYMVDQDKIRNGNDIADDFFLGTEGVVEDVDYCIDYVKDWVDGIDDFADEEGFHVTEKPGYRMAIINDELFTNYNI